LQALDQQSESRRERLANLSSHAFGLALSVLGAALLVSRATTVADEMALLSSIVYGATLVFMYAASTAYHRATSVRAKEKFRRLDHASIFLLIAGTYTPFALVALPTSLGRTILVIVWLAALVGIAVESLGGSDRRLSIALHLAMGWSGLAALDTLLEALSNSAIALLAAGGVAYTLGAVFYAWRQLPFNHAIWHAFVLVGSALHYACILLYIIPAA
jgi:hemolysin III